MSYCYLNGSFLPTAEASLHLNDLGLLRGFAIFDYFRTYNGIPFRQELYLQRFINSAKLMGLEVPITIGGLTEIVAEVHQLSQRHDAAFRLLLTGGYTADSITPGIPNLAVMCEPLPAEVPARFAEGISIITADHLREMAEIKTTNYMKVILLAPQIKSAGAFDVLYHHQGEVSELSRSNFFIFKGDTLITPNANILFGITRRTTLELAGKHFRVEERPLLLEEVWSADEAFTTGTIKKVMPIVKIDDHLINKGVVGRRTQLLQNEFDRFAGLIG
jgi:D-alanine transaminase/branched-chain amino acid aminotransferase